MNLTKPTIHLNGTSAEALTDMYEEAFRAVARALEAVAEAAPNARDYYVQGDGAFEKARAEHETRARKLREVQEELRALAEHCYQD